jgi:hypothetical protein
MNEREGLMPSVPTARRAILVLLVLCAITLTLTAQDRLFRGAGGPATRLSAILGRPTDHSIALSALSATDIEARVEYGTVPGVYSQKSDLQTSKAGVPVEFELGSLQPNTRYCYRLLWRPPGEGDWRPESEGTFHTQRSAGSTFTFAVQGDSHAEREGKMYDPGLYARTMQNVAKDPPDFYLTMGDDFSVERLISRNALTQAAVDQVYAHQRSFLGVVGRSSALFLVNGNHEQAALCNLDGTPNNVAVLAGRARNRFFPLPAPDSFYGGDREEVKYVGLLRDYYSWTWGDALFVVIDFYWHSPVPVDNEAGAGRQKQAAGRRRDLWDATLGDTQYRWLAKTLTESRARWKFVFCHHVLGTGRGGVEVANLCEWGGKDRRGVVVFADKRPGWERPIHDLMVKAGVTIFFQGHDHLYARQELNGVIYQSCPNPADQTYQAFNRDAYHSGDILPNSGYLRVQVAPDTLRVDYVRSFLAADEGSGRINGAVAHSYTILYPGSPAGSTPDNNQASEGPQK